MSNTWASNIQAKLSGVFDKESNLGNYILLFMQFHIGDTDSNSP